MSGPKSGSPGASTGTRRALSAQRVPSGSSNTSMCTHSSSNCSGAQRKKICGARWAGAAGAGWPTGRMPHERSLVARVVAAPTSMVVPPVVMVPVQVPICVRRVASITSRGPSYIVWRGSSTTAVRVV